MPFATCQDGIPPGSSPEGTTKTGGRRHRVTQIIKKARFADKSFLLYCASLALNQTSNRIDGIAVLGRLGAM